MNYFSAVWEQRSLIFMLASREVRSRYRSSFLGLVWAVLLPLALLCIYTFVFTYLFTPRVGEGVDRLDFALSLFCGLIVYNLFADSVGRAPALIVGYRNIVKRQRFPVYILPWVNICFAVFNSAVSFFILIAAIVLLKVEVHLSFAMLPVIVLLYAFILVGGVYIVSALGVYIRDIGQGMPLVLRFAMFVTPVFYPLSVIPERFHVYMFLNPIAFFLHEARKALLLSEPFNWIGLGIYTIAGIGCLFLGIFAFNKMRPGFADVL
jgi:lipopolysaccharide transport system permease protein